MPVFYIKRLMYLPDPVRRQRALTKKTHKHRKSKMFQVHKVLDNIISHKIRLTFFQFTIPAVSMQLWIMMR